MPYIGKLPTTGNFIKLDTISVVNGQVAHTMQKDLLILVQLKQIKYRESEWYYTKSGSSFTISVAPDIRQQPKHGH